jgi:hypothetical protein
MRRLVLVLLAASLVGCGEDPDSVLKAGQKGIAVIKDADKVEVNGDGFWLIKVGDRLTVIEDPGGRKELVGHWVKVRLESGEHAGENCKVRRENINLAE